jgi:hypothetical protein
MIRARDAMIPMPEAELVALERAASARGVSILSG